MSDTNGKSGLWAERARIGLSRERVSAQLDPPISAKTLERWEKGETTAPLWRIQQIAAIYGTSVRKLSRVAATA